jgi:hypothetical protein
MFKLIVNGNSFQNRSGDTWQFVGLSNIGGGYQTMGSGEGTANSNFPNATPVTGIMSLKTQNSLGTAGGSVNWVGTRIK